MGSVSPTLPALNVNDYNMDVSVKMLANLIDSAPIQDNVHTVLKNALLKMEDEMTLVNTPSNGCEEDEPAMKNFTVSFPPPLQLGDSISGWKYDDITQTIGRTYSADVDLAQVLASPKADAILRDLAITSE